MTDQQKVALIREYRGVCDACKPFMVVLSGSVAVTMLDTCRLCQTVDAVSSWDEADALKGSIALVPPLNSQN